MPRYGSADDRRSWSQCAIASREGFDTQLTAAVISTFPLLFGLGPADDVNDQDDDVGHDEPRPRSLERLTSKLE